jgi:PAS domain S-box-containing protein
MIKLFFIAPYEGMKALAQEVLSEYSCNEELYADFLVANYNEIKPKIINSDYDAIIARGVTAETIRENKYQIPLIEIEFNIAEVINALMQCQRIYNSKKVAIIGSPSLMYTGRLLSKISGVSIEIFKLDRSITDLWKLIRRAVQSGCDTIIGGAITCETARKHNINAMVINADKGTIWKAIDEAVRTVLIRRDEREKIKILNTVVENSNEGFLLINKMRKICVCNKVAADILGGTPDQFLDKDYNIVLPYEIQNATNLAVKNKQPVMSEIFVIHKRKYSVSVKPILINQFENGVLVNIQDISAIQQLEQKIRRELHAKKMVAKYSFENLIYKSKKMQDVIDVAKTFSKLDSNVLIEGETGTGKEIFAQSIHANSPRKDKPFVAVNCAAIPENLLESELFGYEGGAFTGASSNGKPGLFELAHNGTLFLDEISEMPMALQAKLLRVLQEQEVRRIGSDKIISIDVRIIAASNKNLLNLVEKDLFRKDLYYRLDVLKIYIPPLRDRPEDIYPLFKYYQEKYAKKFNKVNCVISTAGIEFLKRLPWHGNVRELQNIVERLMAINKNNRIELSHILGVVNQSAIKGEIKDDINIEDTEKNRILFAIRNASSRDMAAKMLGISRTTLWRKLKKYNLN